MPECKSIHILDVDKLSVTSSPSSLSFIEVSVDVPANRLYEVLQSSSRIFYKIVSQGLNCGNVSINV